MVDYQPLVYSLVSFLFSFIYQRQLLHVYTRTLLTLLSTSFIKKFCPALISVTASVKFYSLCISPLSSNYVKFFDCLTSKAEYVLSHFPLVEISMFTTSFEFGLLSLHVLVDQLFYLLLFQSYLIQGN